MYLVKVGRIRVEQGLSSFSCLVSSLIPLILTGVTVGPLLKYIVHFMHRGKQSISNMHSDVHSIPHSVVYWHLISFTILQHILGHFGCGKPNHTVPRQFFRTRDCPHARQTRVRPSYRPRKSILSLGRNFYL